MDETKPEGCPEVCAACIAAESAPVPAVTGARKTVAPSARDVALEIITEEHALNMCGEERDVAAVAIIIEADRRARDAAHAVERDRLQAESVRLRGELATLRAALEAARVTTKAP